MKLRVSSVLSVICVMHVSAMSRHFQLWQSLTHLLLHWPLQDISKRETRQGGQRESPDEDGEEVSEGEKRIALSHTCVCLEKE